jgi:uncharacterized 2Fe-2S/4Fe-4S cluster protein (DUF4445 family)
MPEPGCTVTWQPSGRRVQVPPGATLLAAARFAGLELAALCGGEGTCGACLVRPLSGALTPPNLAESAALSSSEQAAGLRLACQAEVLGSVQVEVPAAGLTTPQRLQLEGLEVPTDLDPPPAWTASLGRPYGLAVDLGTTKLAAYLMDLTSGVTVERAGAMNPQIAYGEDVISRIAYTNHTPGGQAVLQNVVAAAINHLTAELCAAAGAAPEHIVAAVVVGNTCMHHLFAGLPVTQLGVAPYAPAHTAALQLPAAQLGLHLAPRAEVYLPPNIAGFVGADHVAMLLGAGLETPTQTTLALDIGTNTELSLFHQGRHWCCSCASGPAFEGAHIGAGMRAAAGAIERVQLHGAEVRLQVIGGQAPAGLCGSGLLSAAAELRRAGLLDRRGVFTGQHPCLSTAPGQPSAFILAPAERSATGAPLQITRQDIHELQLAKAAIRAGIETLLAAAGLSAAALDRVVLAGAFGTYLDLASAIQVGLLPNLPLERYIQAGNAAGSGARRLLLTHRPRQLAEQIAVQAQYVELASWPGFQKFYLGALSLGA